MATYPRAGHGQRGAPWEWCTNSERQFDLALTSLTEGGEFYGHIAALSLLQGARLHAATRTPAPE